ncbi:cyclin-dependent kinase inhibitor 1C-like [Amphibalanus amphitrite]|uniref:cyclin-dependent kinase inhibitor 1C-like n=1 Tax=Amphibalanus amphitrite TaxID=1232801 RepID=UPI001C912769|nr:cyclin-dependent kinase inhibitor 1C-like [Amphibalanus amphitrite]
MCGTSNLFVVAAVPMAPEVGISEDRAPFWLNRIFGSGRKRKTSTSRDIGTSITEEQLLLESPPSSPGSPGWGGRMSRLPDLVTSCDLRSPGPSGTVFVFPETPAPAPALPAAPAPMPAAPPSPELLERLAWPVPASPRLPASPRAPGGANDLPAAAAAAAAAVDEDIAVDDSVADVGRSLRHCADNLSLSLLEAGPNSPLLPCSVEMAAVCGIACIAAGCVCYKLCK